VLGDLIGPEAGLDPALGLIEPAPLGSEEQLLEPAEVVPGGVGPAVA